MQDSARFPATLQHAHIVTGYMQQLGKGTLPKAHVCPQLFNAF